MVKQEISSVQELIKLLDSSSKDEYKALGKNITIPVQDFDDYLYFEEDSYTRNCIKRTNDYELILLCWEKGQDTPIHCHNNQECWVHVVKGKFHEQRFVEEDGELEMDHEMDLFEEGISYMNDDMGYHSLENFAKGRAVSLHLYMDPIDECNVYDEDKEEFELKELEYHSYAGVLVEEASL